MTETTGPLPILSAQGISKRFAGVVALSDVDLAVFPGQVLAVVGENGAGKSTLIKCLSGVHRPDSGRITVDGEEVTFSSPREAEARGIAVIHQELNLVPALTVAENIFLGREPKRFGFLEKKRMQQEAQALLERLSHPLDTAAAVSKLKISDQQIVEIAKALSLNARVLIMDEPTTALASADVEKLFAVLRKLVQAGTAILYISHKMDELFAIADEFTVLRDGRVIVNMPANDATPVTLVKHMIGREITTARKSGTSDLDEEVLRVSDLTSARRDATGRPRLRNINFSLRRGEVLGIAGLMGAGRTEILEALFGLHPVSSKSSFVIDGKEVKIPGPRKAISRGLALVSEDRKGEGLILGMNVCTNITLAHLKAYTKLGFVDHKGECSVAENWIQKLSIKTPGPKTKTLNLSGGNQQKIVLAKWLLTQPRILLLDEPTKGIDISGKAEIYRLIQELAQAGMGILLVSSELPELLSLSDRVIVIREGELAGEVAAAEMTEERIMELATLGGNLYA